MSVSEMLCWLCGEAAALCPHCRLVASCDVHLSLHHQDTCRPFTLQHSPALGRHLVACRTIEPLETVLTEAAWCLGPCRDTTHLVCVECLAVLDILRHQCPLCLLPLCEDQPCSSYECQLTYGSVLGCFMRIFITIWSKWSEF